MSFTWQASELSTRDASGNYQDDLAVTVDNIVGFNVGILNPGASPVPVDLASASAIIWRYLKGYELVSASTPARVQVGGTLTGVVDNTADTVTFAIPAGTLELDFEYQLRIEVVTSAGVTWVRTREYRAVA